MKKCYFCFVFFFLFCAGYTIAQQPQLHLIGDLDTSFILNDGFEDASIPPFLSGGTQGWIVQGTEVYEGNYSARSWPISDNENSEISISVVVPVGQTAQLTFAYKVSSEIKDILSFTVHNQNVFTVGGIHDWTLHGLELNAGSYDLKWKYEKDGNTSAGDDAAYVDIIQCIYLTNRTFQMADGSEGEGKVLTSDVFGRGIWMSVKSLFRDTDADTRIHVEKNPDEDKIRFELAGQEHFVMHGPVLEIENSGNSVFIGKGAGINDDLGDNENVAVGNTALHLNTSGNKNTAVGYRALHINTGHENTAVGNNALVFNTTGNRNVAVGPYALEVNAAGNNNIAMGAEALLSNTTGNWNIAIGSETMYNNNTGNHNIAIGSQALSSNTTGDENTATGFASMHANTIGKYNTAYGHGTLVSNTEGRENTALGYSVLGLNTTGNYNTSLGSRSMFFNTQGRSNVAVGARALYYNTTRSNLVAIGDSALYHNGINALQFFEARFNTAMGSKALFSNTNGYENTAVGMNALYSNLTGHNNTAIGRITLYENTTGRLNTAVGNLALFNNTTGWYRTAIGFSANSAGDNYNNNTGLGYATTCTASNQVRIGNSSVSSIGGYAGWTTLPCDNRFKKNISDDRVPGLTFISLLRPVTYEVDFAAMESWWAENYNFRDSSTYPEKYDKKNILYTGFIAQEVEAAAQSIGYDFSGVDAPKNNKDFYGLRYATFVVPLVKAVQELSMSNEQLTRSNSELKLGNEELKRSNVRLNKEVDQLKKRMIRIEQNIR